MAERLEKAKQVAEIIKIVSGPLLMIAFAVIFFGPIKELVSVVPDRIKVANEVSAGATGLSWKIQQTAKAQGNPQLAQRLQGLSEDAIRHLIGWDGGADGVGRGLLSSGNQADGSWAFYLLPASHQAAFVELEARGLLQCESKLAEWQSKVAELLELREDSGPGGRTMVVKQSVHEPFARVRDRLNNSCQLSRGGRMAVDLVVDVVGREIGGALPASGSAR